MNARPSFPIGADGKPYTVNMIRMGDWVQMPLEVPLFYENPLGGDYQDFVGNNYQSMEIFDFADRAGDLLDTKNPTAYPSVSWVRISDWMPWMKMRGRLGRPLRAGSSVIDVTGGMFGAIASWRASAR